MKNQKSQKRSKESLFERAFLDQATDIYSRWRYFKERDKNELEERENLLYQRKRNLNKNWKWTKGRLKKVERLNGKLSEFEDVILEYHRKITEKIHKDQKTKNFPFTDYEIRAIVSLFSNKKYKRLGYEDLVGNPFFSFMAKASLPKPGKGYQRERKDYLDFKNTNWNETKLLNPNDPKAYQKHCYLMHELYDHYPLAWSDIVETECVWLDFEVSFQSIKDLLE